ncbi:calmodulin-lysine N-methyltransferase-like isoform X2 [Thrips palmi]|uniref:Calmodulin-lysine N-methyltransferase n=1 Tax=Thrips palmi TaxID=161013 RepID=A0A6P8ZNN2_THRPL|nr:calmodulin-lysine N-methyltransferase-like isoform X2 [Thrips palmi]XP_034242649.1 calmodulin-lysine N-methyltransferase-like isoform X2 [Thrips palmi]
MQSPDGSAPSSPALSDNCENNSPEEYHNVIARSRWRILAQALQKCEVVPTMPSSVRRFQSYGLVSALPLENLHEDSATWYEYRATIGQDLFSVLIRHPKRTFTATDLMGFNNTGNICVWPSEEVLAYYSLCNPNTFSNKSVLELGGGMSCLAGLMIGKYTSASKVLLTDGNVFSINNVHHILVKNGFGNSSRVSSSVLKWGKRANSKVEFLTEELQSKPASLKFDVIICADCLFFDDARQDLVQTIFDFIADDGIALLTAPRRADTLDKFYDKACNAGFICNLQEIYNDQIWDRHLHLKANHGESYNENIHYPLLLQLKKMSFYNSHQVDKSESVS